jgi:hypothetical protein
MLVTTFKDRGCHVVSVTDHYGRILVKHIQIWNTTRDALYTKTLISAVRSIKHNPLGLTVWADYGLVCNTAVPVSTRQGPHTSPSLQAANFPPSHAVLIIFSCSRANLHYVPYSSQNITDPFTVNDWVSFLRPRGWLLLFRCLFLSFNYIRLSDLVTTRSLESSYGVRTE